MADLDVTMSNATADVTAEVECGLGNDYDGRLGLRVSAIFVIGFGSFLGALLPVVLARTKRMHVPKLTFFITKYFGSGVIIATAFIHLLAPATEALQSPCLEGPITEYPWAEGIALMTVFTMFFIELMASRFEIFGLHDQELEAHDPSMDLLGDSSSAEEKVGNGATVRKEHDKVVGDEIVNSNRIPGHDGDLSYPPGGEHHLDHHASHSESEQFAAQMTALFILEFGVIFHSIFIGLTLAVAGEEFVILYIVLVFHQTFEGLGLGSRLATARWPKKKGWMPYALGSAYGLTTPIAIAAGLGVRESFAPGSSQTLIVNGVFDSISAGILLYTGLVELMAHEFMFNQQMRKSSMTMLLAAFGCMCLGAGLMALLGKWA